MKMPIAMLALLAAPAAAATLNVEVSGAGKGGSIVAMLYAAPDGFGRLDAKKAKATLRAAATGAPVGFSFIDLAPGSYAVAAFQDLDGDGKLKTNFIGMPKEPVGVSNNPGGMPGFDKSRVSVPAGGPVKIKLRRLGD